MEDAFRQSEDACLRVTVYYRVYTVSDHSVICLPPPPRGPGAVADIFTSDIWFPRRIYRQQLLYRFTAYNKYTHYAIQGDKNGIKSPAWNAPRS